MGYLDLCLCCPMGITVRSNLMSEISMLGELLIKVLTEVLEMLPEEEAIKEINVMTEIPVHVLEYLSEGNGNDQDMATVIYAISLFQQRKKVV